MLNYDRIPSPARVFQLAPDSNKKPIKKPFINKLVIHLSDAIHLLDFDNIQCIKADGNYSHIIVAQGSNIYCSQSLKQLETRLGTDQFMRIHQSVVVNMQHVAVIGQGHVKLSSGEELPLSRRKRKDVLALLPN